MTDRELSQPQIEILRRLGERFPPDRVECLWIFPPHHTGRRETGLFVLSLVPENGESPEQRTLVTLRYLVEHSKGGKQHREEKVTEEGRAPPDRIERVIAGVLARAGVETGEPRVEAIDADPVRWAALLDRAGVST